MVAENLLPQQVLFVESQPVTVRAILTKSFVKTASPRQAIKAKCLDCSHADREEVRNCTVILCPLHAYRPFQAKP